MNSFDQLQIQIAAMKARGYFEQMGRGLLHRRPTHDAPFAQWLEQLNGVAHENHYFPLEYLTDSGAPTYVLSMVETYNPDTEAVVCIESDDPDVPSEPRIVPLDSFPAVNREDLPF